jgi:aspartate racemase
MVPDEAARTTIHDIIYNELCQGIVSPASKQAYLEIIEQARRNGADGVIFGCTEVGLLVGQTDFDLPAFDTTELHARAALDFALHTTEAGE